MTEEQRRRPGWIGSQNLTEILTGGTRIPARVGAGSKAVRAAASQASGRPVAGFTVLAEYRGAGGLVVQGPVSGKRYLFPVTGARALIDVRDHDIGRTVRGLRLLESR